MRFCFPVFYKVVRRAARRAIRRHAIHAVHTAATAVTLACFTVPAWLVLAPPAFDEPTPFDPNIVAVPEPSSLAILAVAGVALLVIRRLTRAV